MLLLQEGLGRDRAARAEQHKVLERARGVPTVLDQTQVRKRVRKLGVRLQLEHNRLLGIRLETRQCALSGRSCTHESLGSLPAWCSPRCDRYGSHHRSGLDDRLNRMPGDGVRVAADREVVRQDDARPVGKLGAVELVSNGYESREALTWIRAGPVRAQTSCRMSALPCLAL